MICSLSREAIESIVKDQAVAEAKLAQSLNLHPRDPEVLDEYMRVQTRLQFYQKLLPYKPEESRVSYANPD